MIPEFQEFNRMLSNEIGGDRLGAQLVGRSQGVWPRAQLACADGHAGEALAWLARYQSATNAFGRAAKLYASLCGLIIQCVPSCVPRS